VRILREAAQQLSVAGVEGVSLGGVATALAMSKPGVVGPFASRENLLLAAFDDAVELFRERVVAPVVAIPRPGAERLAALIDAWIDYLADCPFRGGCVMTSLSVDVDNRPGELRDRVAAATRRWHEFLADELRAAATNRHLLPAPVDDLVALLAGLAMALNQELQLLGNRSSRLRVRRLMRASVGLTPGDAPEHDHGPS